MDLNKKEEQPSVDDPKKEEILELKEPKINVTKEEEIKDQQEDPKKEETAKTNGPEETKRPVLDFFKDLFSSK